MGDDAVICETLQGNSVGKDSIGSVCVEAHALVCAGASMRTNSAAEAALLLLASSAAGIGGPRCWFPRLAPDLSPATRTDRSVDLAEVDVESPPRLERPPTSLASL